jgi:hypothetical protein
MKALFTMAVLGLFSAAMIGCEASAKVGDDDNTHTRTTVRDRDGADTTYKKTTTIDRDGDRTVRTEKSVDR